MCRDGKEMNLKMIMTPMIGGTKLNLVLMDQMNNEKNNSRGLIGATPTTHEKAKRDGHFPNHIHGVLVRYKDVLTNGLSKNYCQKKKTNFSRQDIEVLGYMVTNDGIKLDMKKVKAIQEWRFF